MTLTLTLKLKIAFLDFVAAGGIPRVSQTHLDIFYHVNRAKCLIHINLCTFHVFKRKTVQNAMILLCPVQGPWASSLSIEHLPPHPVYQDPTCTANFLYRYTSLISAASWYTGGTMFYKIISFLVDYIVKKWHFCSKISKIMQYIEVILSETNDGYSYK